MNPTLSLPALKIRRVVRADDSGSTASFTEYLSKVDPAWASAIGSGLHVSWPRGVEVAKGNEGIATAIATTVGAIGYAATNQVAKAKLSYISLQNRSKHFVFPTDAALHAAVKSSIIQRSTGIDFIDAPGIDAWPITDATYVLIERNPKNPDRVRSVLRFFYWAFLRGDAMASESGYVPLPAAIQARVVGMFREVQDQQGNTLDFMGAQTHGSAVLAGWQNASRNAVGASL